MTYGTSLSLKEFESDVTENDVFLKEDEKSANSSKYEILLLNAQTVSQAKKIVCEYMYKTDDVNKLWDASLNAHMRLLDITMEKLDVFDIQSIKDPRKAFLFNNLFSDAVSSLSFIQSGKNRVTFPIEETVIKLAICARKVQITHPRHKFPDSVSLATIMKVLPDNLMFC